MNRDKLPYLLPIRSLVFFLIFVLGSLITGKELSAISNWWTIAATIVNIFTIALLLVVSKKNDMTYWELINYQKGETKARQVVLISIVVLVVGMGVMYLAGFLCYGKFPYAPPMMIAPVMKLLAIINCFLLPVTTLF